MARAAVDSRLDSPISFRSHELRTGSLDGARADFEQMLAQLVGSTIAGVRAVQANPGDWGIDCFVGELDRSGKASVWQSKFFIDGVRDSQKAQIRESFKAAVTAAADAGYILESWILCIPCSMDGPTTAWWDNWVKRQKKLGVAISLWDETELITRLLSIEGDRVCSHYYGAKSVDDLGNTHVSEIPDGEDFDSALFVRQLLEAGHVELDSAKREFFNAELIAREVLDKGVAAEMRQLSAADAGVQLIWEHRFNAACENNTDLRLPGLHSDVMADIRAERQSLMPHVTSNIVHMCGMAHRVVEDSRAGWVRNWRDVAADHLDADGEANIGELDSV